MLSKLTGVVLCLLVFAGPAGAAEIFHIGGNDRISQYEGFDSGQTNPGMFTFNENANGGNPIPDLGVVTSEDLSLGAGNCPSGATFLCTAKVGFNAILGPISRLGGSFDPATSNIKQAVFLGLPGPDMYFLDPADNSTVLLAFELNFIHVTQASFESIPANEDGTILMGNPDPSAISSQLFLMGGTLNQLVGGIGSEARLEILMDSLTPAIMVKGDFKGYLNGNFLSGLGDAPVLPTTWNLTIIPVPEPSTAGLLGVSLLGLLALARRRALRS